MIDGCTCNLLTGLIVAGIMTQACSGAQEPGGCRAKAPAPTRLLPRSRPLRGAFAQGIR